MTSGSDYALVESDALSFHGYDNNGIVFSAPVLLKGIQGVAIQFSLDCPEELAGTAIHIDLCAEGYDSDEQEYVATLLVGKNRVSCVLDKGENAPDEAHLRIFTLESAEYVIHDLTAEPVLMKARQVSWGLMLCILLLLVSVAWITTDYA